MDQALIEQIPSTLTYQDGDKQLAYRDHPLVKEAPDLPTFVKMSIDGQRELGRRLPLNIRPENKDGDIADWKKNHLPRLYDAGIIDRPAASPDDYNDLVKKPESLPDGFGWSDDLSKEFKEVAHKYNIPKGAIPALLALHEKTITGVSHVLATNEEQAMLALKTEHGAAFPERMELAKRLATEIIKTPEEVEFFNRTKLGNSPTLLGVLMRLAPLAQADSSFFTNSGSAGGQGGTTLEEAKAEHAKIATDKTHPMHTDYNRSDPKVMEHIDNLYRKAVGDGKVVIG